MKRVAKIFCKLAIPSSLLFFTLGCGDIENSSTSDEMYYSDSVGGPEFVEASIVLKKYCIQCHEFAGFSEIELAALESENGAAYVKANNLDGSLIYSKIRGNKSNTTGNMPTNGSVPSSEIRKIENWIMSL